MRNLLLTLAFLFVAVSAQALSPDSVAYHNFATDSANISRILDCTRKQSFDNAGSRLLFVAQQFIGTPYEAGTLEGDTEQLVVNTSKLDCTTFVETALALTLTAQDDTAKWCDFAPNLLKIRYRNGILDGYSSRLHYMSDWVVNNSQNGTLTEVTPLAPKAAKTTVNLNFMTTHTRSYQALFDNAEECEKMKKIEAEYANYSCHYIPKNMLNLQPVKKFFRDGDIVLITTSTAGLDVSHMGIVVMKNGMPYLLHASSKSMCVILDNQPLSTYVPALRGATGVRVLRLNDNDIKQ